MRLWQCAKNWHIMNMNVRRFFIYVLMDVFFFRKQHINTSPWFAKFLFNLKISSIFTSQNQLPPNLQQKQYSEDKPGFRLIDLKAQEICFILLKGMDDRKLKSSEIASHLCFEFSVCTDNRFYMYARKIVRTGILRQWITQCLQTSDDMKNWTELLTVWHLYFQAR